jgi:hypothetical protein
MHQCSVSFFFLLIMADDVKRAFEFCKPLWDNVKIDCSGVDRFVAKKTADCIKVCSLIE